MRLGLFIIMILNISLVACSPDSQSEEIGTETEVLDLPPDQAQSVGGDEEAPMDTEAPLVVGNKSLDDAYNSFLAQGVPMIPLKRAFDFYRNNLASAGGLQDTSCLIKPMSETGEIEKNSNRYDPTTLSMLKTGIRNERYIMIVDFTKSNTTARGYLLDLQPDTEGNYTVVKMLNSHGYGSQAVNGVPQVFTNASGKGTTVSGFFLTATVTYPYYGNISSGSYSSTGLRLYGLESTNNTAEKTSKVSHGAPYVSDDRAGNSAGCPAMKFENASKYLPKLKGGTLWYHHTKINNSLSYKAPSC